MAKEHIYSSQLNDPWDLPAYFLLRTNKSRNLRTHSGYWKEKEEVLTAIRRSSGESSAAVTPPSYVGVKKTLEFYLNDGTNGGKGTKTDWIIHEYHNLRKDDGTEDLFLEDDVVLRKVFKKCKNKTDQASSVYRQVESCVKAYREVYSRRGNYYGNKSNVILRTDDSESVAKEIKKYILELAVIRLVRQLTEGLVNLELEKALRKLVLLHFEQEEALPKLGNNIWKHFTKICSASDPDEVYAVCHRCDKVLKAHPKKHGTSHLKRHIHTCSSCTNPSTYEDRALLHCLRTVRDDPYEQQKMDSQEDHLTPLDPWDLNLIHPTPWYVTRSLNRQTQGGHWKEINKDFTAIRMDQQRSWKDIDKEIAVMQMVPVPVPVPVLQYMGLRRTLQFHLHDGRKLDWIMLEYQQLDGIQSPALLLQGDMVIRKIFRYDKDAVSSAFSELDRQLNGDDDDEEYFNGEGMNTGTTIPIDYMDTPSSVFRFGEVVNTDATTTSSSDYMDTVVDRKRKRAAAAPGHKSDVWMHFTKIYNTDHGLVYVVCHSCDRGYGSGCSTNGTSHLWRHNKSCTSKRSRTGNGNDATTEWEAEIRPLFLVLKNYGEHQPSGGMC